MIERGTLHLNNIKRGRLEKQLPADPAGPAGHLAGPVGPVGHSREVGPAGPVGHYTVLYNTVLSLLHYAINNYIELYYTILCYTILY